MDLKELASDESVQNNVKKSGNSSSGEYPKYDARIPRLAIIEEDGEMVYKTNPQNYPIEYVKEKEGASWERFAAPEDMVRHWMTDAQVMRVKHMVKDTLGADLFELLDKDPEIALRVIKKAAKNRNTDNPNFEAVDCAVCGTEIDLVYGSYEEINNRRVCKSHNVKELADADLL